jgi:hypothetical protein
MIKVEYKDGSIRFFSSLNDIFDENKLDITQVICCNNGITKIPNEIGQLLNLHTFICSFNNITEIPNEIGQLLNLHTFICLFNKIIKIPNEIGQLINLHTLDCSNNKITELPKEIGQLINLHTFRCSFNKISEIPNEIGQLINLHTLDYSNNYITQIPDEIGQLINLHDLYCPNNKITNIPNEIGQLINLRTLDYSNNYITQIPIDIINCRNLRYFECYDNEIVMNPVIQRFINRMFRVDNHKIYADGQNVHSSSIQQSVKESIINLLNDKFVISDDDLRKQILDNDKILYKEQLFEYIDGKEEHSTLYCTFKDLFVKVYGRIIGSESQEDLWKRLNEELSESDCKCYTGRLSRLVNVLNGYYLDIRIMISDSEQISNIIISIKKRLLDEKEIKDECIKELKERGYDEELIGLWVDNL